ncbi:MAG: hypothetical protein OXH38_07855 [Chloroflexi bacterium]|nr:hypothetical protein [Chloroflexota bacterium]
MMRRLLGWFSLLAALGGVGLGGWFVGSDVIAPQPSAEDVVVAESVVAGRLQIEIDEAAFPNTSLVLGASGLSPFGNAEGLQGRQVLTGRVISASNGYIVIETQTGQAAIQLTDETTFLLRMQRVSPAAIGSGASVTIILDEDGETAIAALALPADSRPTLNTPDPPSLGGG